MRENASKVDNRNNRNLVFLFWIFPSVYLFLFLVSLILNKRKRLEVDKQINIG